jgi:hypothetical protein
VASLDRWFAEKGALVDENDEPYPASKLYVALYNAAQRAHARLEEYLDKRTSATDPFDKYRNMTVVLSSGQLLRTGYRAFYID